MTPLTRRAALSLATGLLVPAMRAAPAPQTKLLFGGDVMLCRYIGDIARQKQDPALPLRELAPVLAAADIAFVNLESPFSDKGKPVERGMLFKAEPEMVAALNIAGIEVVSTANNHARDRGGYGIEFTFQWLAQNGIAAVGTGLTAAQAHEGAVLIRNGLRFGFLAYAQDQTNGNYKDLDDRVCDMDIPRMRQDIAAMRSRADVVIVSMHGGVEYWTRVHGIQTKFAHAAIDAGARVVAGHHPHVVQPWERYGSGVIFYSLGNLVFDQFQRKETQRGLLAEVIFEGVEITAVNPIPIDIVQGLPRLSTMKAAP